MDPVSINLSLDARRNDDPRRFRFLIDDDGVFVDFTAGYAAKMQIRERPGGSGTPLVDVESGPVSGSRIDLLVDGFEIILYKTDMTAIPEDLEDGSANCYYDILITEPGGDVNPWYHGTFTLHEGVTVA